MENQKISEIESGHNYQLFYNVEAFRKYVKSKKIKIAYFFVDEYSEITKQMEKNQVIELDKIEQNGENKNLSFLYVRKDSEGNFYLDYIGSIENDLSKDPSPFESYCCSLVRKGFALTRDVINDMIKSNVITKVVSSD